MAVKATDPLYILYTSGTPDPGTFWRIISEYGTSALFTAPTAFRAIRKEDPDGNFIRKYDLKSLRTLFLAGGRADPETVKRAEQQLKVPVVDHWWQTETGWSIAANPVGLGMLPVKHGSPTVASLKCAMVVPRLPKTRSGKILRATMRKIADKEEWKMPATINDPTILDEITVALKAKGLA